VILKLFDGADGVGGIGGVGDLDDRGDDEGVACGDEVTVGSALGDVVKNSRAEFDNKVDSEGDPG